MCVSHIDLQYAAPLSVEVSTFPSSSVPGDILNKKKKQTLHHLVLDATTKFSPSTSFFFYLTMSFVFFSLSLLVFLSHDVFEININCKETIHISSHNKSKILFSICLHKGKREPLLSNRYSLRELNLRTLFLLVFFLFSFLLPLLRFGSCQPFPFM